LARYEADGYFAAGRPPWYDARDNTHAAHFAAAAASAGGAAPGDAAETAGVVAKRAAAGLHNAPSPPSRAAVAAARRARSIRPWLTTRELTPQRRTLV
jgi:hypothetical protein